MTQLVWEYHPVAERLRPILQAWKGTKYCEGQNIPGVAVDCTHFTCSSLDQLYGYAREWLSIPADACLHNKKLAMRAMRAIRRRYMPNEIVTNNRVQPGDLIVTGPTKGGPGHAMIVGFDPNTIWHIPGPRFNVTITGMTLPSNLKLFRIYRASDREKWLS